MKSIVVLGLGKVGALAADLLQESGFDVRGYDSAPRPGPSYPVHQLDTTDGGALASALDGADAVLSCLPYSLNIAVADAAHAAGIHYFDLTEDVPTTRHILELART